MRTSEPTTTLPHFAAQQHSCAANFILSAQQTSPGGAISWRIPQQPGRRAGHGRRRRPERQQILLRRGLALGGGLLLLILIVLGVKGCLDARKNRALSDYARNVTQIVEETERTSKSFFGKLSEPGELSVTEFVNQVNADRSAMDSYASRVDGLDAPGDMGTPRARSSWSTSCAAARWTKSPNR